MTVMVPMFFSFVATLCAGVFFGAAVYISVGQHPAALAAGGIVPGRLFAPMYRRAAPMQASLAIIGAASAVAAWATGFAWAWLVGGIILFLVVPFTLIRMKPVNDKLKEPTREPESPETLALLHRWGLLHWVRSALSGVAFLIFLVELAFV